MMYAPRLGNTGIEYLDKVWNFYSGCRHWRDPAVCPVGEFCWAKGTTGRFSNHYPNGFEPTFYPEAFLSPLALKKPSRIGVCFMGDLFMDEISPDLNLAAVELASSTNGKTHLLLPNVPLRKAIFTTVGLCPQHTFVFLTKNPAGLLPWSPFPDNCHVGATVCNPDILGLALENLAKVQAGVKWLSFEPTLERITVSPRVLKEAGIGWVVIGGLTGTRERMIALQKEKYPDMTALRLKDGGGPKWGLLPPLAWVSDLVLNAGAAGIPVFLKDNIYKVAMECSGEDHDLYWEDMANLRREYPKARVQTKKEYAAELYLGHAVVGGS